MEQVHESMSQNILIEKRQTKTTTKKAEVKKQPIKANNEKKKAEKNTRKKKQIRSNDNGFCYFWHVIYCKL